MKNHIKNYVLLIIFLFIVVVNFDFISADNYTVDVFFTVPSTVYQTGERIEIKGYVYLGNFSTNGSIVTNSSGFANATVNLTVRNINGTFYRNYSFTTDTNGSFYSKSNYYSTAIEINASTVYGDYNLRAEYIDPNNKTWFSDVEITVVNSTIDLLHVSAEKAKYNPSERVVINIESIRIVGDRISHISNVSVNGTLRNSTKGILSSYNCTTGSNGKCTVNVTAPTSYGDYFLELNNFKAFSRLQVVPFSVNVYMKDELGKSLRNVFAGGEKARVEVSVLNASSSDEYNFSGYIKDSSGNVVKTINSTQLIENNSFSNSFQFTIDTITFSNGAYVAFVTVNKQGDGSINSTASFEIKDWVLSIDKKSSDSGFEYELSTFPNRTMRFEALPTYRSNGSVIENLSSTLFTIQLKDSLNNVVSTGNSTWNSTCGTGGCYEFIINSTNSTGQFTLYVTLSYNGNTQTSKKIINIIDGVMSAQSSDSEGSLKELFGANEYIYFSLTSYNLTSSFNLSDAEIFSVRYMNGSEFNYTNVSYSDVNYSNSVYEWGWNSTLQRIKLDAPNIGGLYNVFIFGNNRTIGKDSRFIINPYDFCSVPKDTPGSVSGASGYYYIWQFKTTDTIYFENKVTQAVNPLGRATALNTTTGNGTGSASGCTIDTSTKQVVNNATINISEVRNQHNGALQNLNLTESNCKSDDNSGGYTCTVTPLTKWDSGINIVKFIITGQDGTTAVAFSRFEARSFYLYGYSTTWQNSPTSNISLTVQIYEAGSGWWGSSSGLSGTVTVKKVEYMGRDGEWVWPPVESGYNVSNLSASITTGSGSITLPVANTLDGTWKTGNYRVILEGKTNSGDTDYGYAWFGIKLWDAYATPIHCTNNSCVYKDYFNSKENVTLYVKISKAGSYNYNYGGKENIWGNVSITVKKVQDCSKWPCTELNSSKYNATTLWTNESSPWYWSSGSNSVNQSKFLLQINRTEGSWDTGWYSVILDINGTDTGYGWFNAIAFYVDARPTDTGGVNYKYAIKPGENMYYNVTVTKGYRGWNSNYNASDYVNVSFSSLRVTSWDQNTYSTKEYSYPLQLNITPTVINGSVLVNISYLNGSWPSGYYWGELVYKDRDNATSTGRLWFNVIPFRLALSRGTGYEADEQKCVNASISVYEPSWYSNTYIYGNYSIQSVYEDVWTTGSRSRINLTNYTSSASFNGTMNVTLCPNGGSWGNGNWGGYHFVQVVVKDNANNNSGTGGIDFRAMPFKIQWGSVGGGSTKLTTEDIVVQANITTFLGGTPASANLTTIYQWRYDESFSGKQTYVFKVANCWSNVSGQCNVTGAQNVTIYAPSVGWKEGYNYFYTEWNKVSDASSKFSDWSGVNIDVKKPYSGNYDNVDSNGNWKNRFNENENLTIRVNIRHTNNSNANVSITDVQYSNAGNNCWSEWCKTYTSATWSLVEGGSDTGIDGKAIIHLRVPSGNWSNGEYSFKVSVSGVNGTASITGGNVRVINSILPNISLSSPSVNQSINQSTFSVNFTTNKAASCWLALRDYGNFNSSFCGNATNSSTNNQVASCNVTLYGFSINTNYYYEFINDNYHSASTGVSYWWESGSTGLTTGGTTHSYIFNASNKVNGQYLKDQDYSLQILCWDSDWNSASEHVAIRINLTTNISTVSPAITINSPSINQYIGASSATFNFSSNKNGSCLYSLNNGTANFTMSTTGNGRGFNATNSSIPDGKYWVFAYCNDTFGNNNFTTFRNFTIDTTNPLIIFGTGSDSDNFNISRNWIYLNGSYTETNINNITYRISFSNGSLLNSTTSTNNRFVNFTGLSDNTYKLNITVTDKANNKNTSDMRTMTVDTTIPSISYGAGTQNNFANITSNYNWIYVNVTFTEINFANITFSLKYNNGSNNITVNRTTFTTPIYIINWTGLALTNYTYNVTVYDTASNKNFTSTRYINLSAA